MTFCIISHVNHHQEQDQYFAYAPYVREMNIWLKYVDKVLIVAPLEKVEITAIDIAYQHTQIQFQAVSEFSLIGFKNKIKTLFLLPTLIGHIFKAMKQADHIHLRCPGNMGLLGSIVQIFFPKKKKTAKYAGNWDSNSKQPWSYRLQKWILNNTFLTKNMQVLVYGAWEGSSENIKPFFTATYAETDKTDIAVRALYGRLEFLFVGSLAIGKRPMYAIQLVEHLKQKGHPVRLQIFGAGEQERVLKEYIKRNHLEQEILFRGNQDKQTVLTAYQSAHFLILASRSEGWPKVVAEAMFWACVPLASKVSCVPEMLDQGKRGILLDLDLGQDLEKVQNIIAHPETYQNMALNGMLWSRQFTMEKFAREIKKIL